MHSVTVFKKDFDTANVFMRLSLCRDVTTPRRQITRGFQMSKLLNSYRVLPTADNRAKLQKYLDKHMMAVCMASTEEIAYLRACGFSI